MNLRLESARALAQGLAEQAEGLKVEVGVAPPFPLLAAVKEVAGPAVRLVGQNCHFEPDGAFTGEVSVGMLADVGCDYVLIGHSERRQWFGETDEGVCRKLHAIQEAGLSAIVALGETLEQRDACRTREVVEGQLSAALEGQSSKQLASIVLAYEPVWAIGTGRTATPEQAQEVHAWLRAKLLSDFGEGADQVRIQYGGSMKPGNAAELMAQPDIDGGLIGGASLKIESFLEICRAAPA